MELLLDADATINLRSLGVLEVLLKSDITLTWTSYVFENELSSLQAELGPLRMSRRLHVAEVRTRTTAHALYKQLKQDGVDKGEAEAIAWSRNNVETRGPRFFVSDDGHARASAGDDPPAIRSAECVALLVATGRLKLHRARELLSVWDDRSQHQGRPKRWQSFDSDFAPLLNRVRARFADILDASRR